MYVISNAKAEKAQKSTHAGHMMLSDKEINRLKMKVLNQ